ncbi:squalene/phytoene synthase family protein [Hellea sp.]|nr:squalene/phytoene synthase family protein [Hellea sp.]
MQEDLVINTGIFKKKFINMELYNLLSQLKHSDPDRYRAAVFADRNSRNNLNIIYGFHYELAKIPEIASDNLVGSIRYQWWREVVDSIYSNNSLNEHYILQYLSNIIIQHEIPRYWIDKLIDGRERDLNSTSFSDLNEAKSYCRNTSGTLMKIATKSIGINPNEGVLKAGEAWGLIGLARSYKYYHKTMLSNINFNEICNEASDIYYSALIDLKHSPDKIFPAVAYITLIPKFLEKLQNEKHKPRVDPIILSPLSKKICLLKAALFNIY